MLHSWLKKGKIWYNTSTTQGVWGKTPHKKSLINSQRHATNQTLHRNFLPVASAERLPISPRFRQPPPRLDQSLPRRRPSIGEPLDPFPPKMPPKFGRIWGRFSFSRSSARFLGVGWCLGGSIWSILNCFLVDRRLEMGKTSFKLEHPLGLPILSCLLPC